MSNADVKAPTVKVSPGPATTSATASASTAEAGPPEPRWPAMVAMLAGGVIFFTMPRGLVFGPRWLALALIAAIIVPYLWLHRRGNQKLPRLLGYLATAALTLFLSLSLTLLIIEMLHKGVPPRDLLASAAALWVANILVFALWYWRLDAGGPYARETRASHDTGAFLFPQMIMHSRPAAAWRPHFIDYLFLAFNTSTAFSPTDTAILSRWAKVLMMIQAAISLTVVALLAGRAINIL